MVICYLIIIISLDVYYVNFLYQQMHDNVLMTSASPRNYIKAVGNNQRHILNVNTFILVQTKINCCFFVDIN